MNWITLFYYVILYKPRSRLLFSAYGYRVGLIIHTIDCKTHRTYILNLSNGCFNINGWFSSCPTFLLLLPYLTIKSYECPCIGNEWRKHTFIQSFLNHWCMPTSLSPVYFVFRFVCVFYVSRMSSHSCTEVTFRLPSLNTVQRTSDRVIHYICNQGKICPSWLKKYTEGYVYGSLLRLSDVSWNWLTNWRRFYVFRKGELCILSQSATLSFFLMNTPFRPSNNMQNTCINVFCLSPLEWWWLG